jgi:hypothetical protein
MGQGGQVLGSEAGIDSQSSINSDIGIDLLMSEVALGLSCVRYLQCKTLREIQTWQIRPIKRMAQCRRSRSGERCLL